MSGIRNLEQRGLWLSIAGALFMAALGIGFAIVTSSDAVLLDGLFRWMDSSAGWLRGWADGPACGVAGHTSRR